jgi:chromosome transmission fidelity protein 8
VHSGEQIELLETINLGRLVFPPPDDGNPENTAWDRKRVLLFIGKHQKMAGEVKVLKNAIAVLGRPAQPTASSARDGCVEVIEVVRWKMVFASRPEPMGAGVEMEVSTGL